MFVQSCLTTRVKRPKPRVGTTLRIAAERNARFGVAFYPLVRHLVLSAIREMACKGYDPLFSGPFSPLIHFRGARAVAVIVVRSVRIRRIGVVIIRAIRIIRIIHVSKWKDVSGNCII